ncbi:unnamed protein product [Anisakis simplex]|uniref:Membrane lipoprotein n=1 Tax=Anisakis simplex TaxID=6269 RepID=A0A0M3JUE8_ANISI|nr:unnamed protein product [Anisakis simplex]
MSSECCLRFVFLITAMTVVFFCSSNAAPAVCRTCTNGACNNTDDASTDFDSALTGSNRTKRASTIEQRSCVQFQLEMVLIPLSIAMIPVGLCALLLCACCCGPEESRGKIPDRFTKKGNSSRDNKSGKSLSCANSKKDVNEVDDIELVYKDGVVMRRDSKKTRFSTAVSIIEARRISIDILEHQNDRRQSIFSIGDDNKDDSLSNANHDAPDHEQQQQPSCCQQGELQEDVCPRKNASCSANNSDDLSGECIHSFMIASNKLPFKNDPLQSNQY